MGTAHGATRRAHRVAAERGLMQAAPLRDHAQAPWRVRERPQPLPQRTIERGAADWPEALEALHDVPSRLHLAGSSLPPMEHAVALVGARAATPYGLDRAHRLAHDLASLGYTVVSGLARGIDAAAHEGALAAGGRTVAVLPSGLDRVTPPEHTGLASRIAASGTLVSEVDQGGPFGPGAFVRRNRLIAALAGATVVVEAGARSGALTTAAFAQRMGRTLLTLPGDVDRPGMQGPLQLMREGAAWCADAADVRAAMVRAGHAAPAGEPAAALSAALGRTPLTLERLAAAAGVSPAEAAAAMLVLEWTGVAVAVPGGRWRRRA